MDNEQQIKKEYDNISNKLLSENPVCKLSGEEFSPIEGKTLKQQVIDYFNTCGNSASTQFGNVLFDEKGIKNALHHGMSRTKAIAFAAIKTDIGEWDNYTTIGLLQCTRQKAKDWNDCCTNNNKGRKIHLCC